MMTFSEVATATLDQLTDELAAAGWDSCETSVESARESMARLLAESMPVAELMSSLDAAGLESQQDWSKGATTWRVCDGLRIRVEGEDVEVTSGQAGASISINCDGSWAGSGKLRDGVIEDCSAQFCDDADESLAVYDEIEAAIAAGKSRIKVELDGETKVIDWAIQEAF